MMATRRTLSNFYPRPPRGGRRLTSAITAGSTRFLSTPSARRATVDLRSLHSCQIISIHALREEGDVCVMNYREFLEQFLSTPSARRATAHT